jgi:hypothetical protein
MPSNKQLCLSSRNLTLSRIKDKLYGIESNFIKKPFIEHSEKTNKIKRNLNIISLIIIIMTVLDVSISRVSLVGVQVTGITESKLLTILLVLLLYHLVFFVWSSIDEYWKWRLNLICEDTADYTKRQTSDDSLSKVQAAVDSNLYLKKDAMKSLHNQLNTAVCQSIKNNGTRDSSEGFEEKFESVWMSSMQPIIEQDLARVVAYERSYRNYHWQDVIKLVTLEFGFPILFSLYAGYQAYLAI